MRQLVNRPVLLVLWTVMGLACQRTPDAVDGPLDHSVVAVRIVATPGANGLLDSVAVGEARPLVATGLAADGTVLAAHVGWASSDTLVATVSATGVVVGHRTGSVLIHARAANDTIGTLPLTVVLPPVAAVQLSPRDTTMLAPDTLILRAHLLDQNGADLGNRPVTWSSSDSTVLWPIAITPTALEIRPHGIGTVTVVARTVNGVTATTTVRIVPDTIYTLAIPTAISIAANDTAPHTFTVVGRSARGRTLPGSVFSNTLVGQAVTVTTRVRFDGYTEVTYRAIAPGSATLYLTLDGIQGAVAFSVVPPSS